jgi:hypothetical protein
LIYSRTDVTVIDRSSGYLFYFGAKNSEAYIMLANSSSRNFFYQDNRSRVAMEALEKLNEPLSTVLRNGEPIRIYCSNCNRRSSNCREEIQLMPMERLYTAMISR